MWWCVLLTILTHLRVSNAACQVVTPYICPTVQNLRCHLMGRYRQMVPEDNDVALSFFENVSLGDRVYNMLENFWCPPASRRPCPTYPKPTLPTQGLYEITNLNCLPVNGYGTSVTFVLTMYEKITTSGDPSAPGLRRFYMANVKARAGNYTQLILQEIGGVGSYHHMLRYGSTYTT